MQKYLTAESGQLFFVKPTSSMPDKALNMPLINKDMHLLKPSFKTLLNFYLWLIKLKATFQKLKQIFGKKKKSLKISSNIHEQG